jgi:hypothetical protein
VSDVCVVLAVCVVLVGVVLSIVVVGGVLVVRSVVGMEVVGSVVVVGTDVVVRVGGGVVVVRGGVDVVRGAVVTGGATRAARNRATRPAPPEPEMTHCEPWGCQQPLQPRKPEPLATSVTRSPAA